MNEGDRYGRLVVREVLSGENRHGRMCRVRCDCGVRKTVPARHVAGGRIRSCGKGNCRETMQRVPCPLCGSMRAKVVAARHERVCARRYRATQLESDRARVQELLAQIPGRAA